MTTFYLVVIGFIFLSLYLIMLLLPKRLKESKSIFLNPDSFPKDFLWGTGEDAYQHEGSNYHNDWAEWEGRTKPFKDGENGCAGRASDFWNKWQEDFNLAKNDGQNVHRIGIEWSRIEPDEGKFDREAIEQYKAMLKDLKAKGMTTFVNLWHFTLPIWISKKGGFETNNIFPFWERYVKLCAEEFGPFTDFFSTMIDSQIYALRGYFVGEIPPNKIDSALGLKVYKHLAIAHVIAYETLKKHAPQKEKTQVGIIYFFTLYEKGKTPLDSFVHKQMDNLFNWDFLDSLYSGSIDLRVFGNKRIKKIIHTHKNTIDWLGINYYTRELLSFSTKAPGLLKRTTLSSAPLTDMRWEIYPEGMYKIIKILEKRYPKVPFYITENGLADATDTKRPRFIVDYISYLKKALDTGSDVRGYFFWSLTDNLEWTDGYWPKFGLYQVDRTTYARTETRSARVFRFIAKNNRLPSEKEFLDIK